MLTLAVNQSVERVSSKLSDRGISRKNRNDHIKSFERDNPTIEGGESEMITP